MRTSVGSPGRKRAPPLVGIPPADRAANGIHYFLTSRVGDHAARRREEEEGRRGVGAINSEFSAARIIFTAEESAG